MSRVVQWTESFTAEKFSESAVINEEVMQAMKQMWSWRFASQHYGYQGMQKMVYPMRYDTAFHRPCLKKPFVCSTLL